MNRIDVIILAEDIGLLYSAKSSFTYNHPQHQRLISKLEKFAQECYDKGFASGWDEARSVYETGDSFHRNADIGDNTVDNLEWKD